ncbi:NAD(P)H-quinone oxidoreductase subunit L, chloroplastic [Sesamum angolense]|uniref:NAD(P)H-quinone oxidoreductase subunit L, chloroplastic n=1 Tax=Sesamum angolense TaxID=2727404 RepID=A0AAE2C5D9_9LAMI|nr:NAD(P)H-quinone oxidoreductase subunit L, chloroplastic [Sesamum angolense]
MSSFHILKALPSLSLPSIANPNARFVFSPFLVNRIGIRMSPPPENRSQLHTHPLQTKSKTPELKLLVWQFKLEGFWLLYVAQPAFAVTGVNEEEDLIWILIQSGISAFFYFIVVPPIIMNWLRTRWYKRNLLEMYVQFMFVFIFYPGVLLWAPFLNFRKFPRDPTMKYPWSTPQDPSQIKGGFLKYPWAQPEDYE